MKIDMTAVVVNSEGKFLLVLGVHTYRWVPEYPDATKFRTDVQAALACARRNIDGVDAVTGYGTTDEYRWGL